MSDRIDFRGASIRYIDVRQGKEGGDVFCRIHMSADYSEQVREKMEWPLLSDSITDCKLSGQLLGTNFVLTPGDNQLRQYELNFDISSVEDFQVKSEHNDEGEVSGRRLDFIVRTPKDGVEAFCGQYIRRVGRHEGLLKIRYSVQEKLDLDETNDAKPETEEQDPDTGCISCNNGIPFEDGENTTHASGMRCTRTAESSTLASAREAAGGTHAKGGRKQRRQPQPEPDQAIADAEAEEAAMPVH